MKKWIPTIAMYLGSFVVINTGMYFFLNATQPKTNTQALLAAHTDSTEVEHDKGDNTHKTDEIKQLDSQEIAKHENHSEVSGKADQTEKDNNAIENAKVDHHNEIAEHATEEVAKPQNEKAKPAEIKESEKESAPDEDASTLAAMAGTSKEMIKLSKMLESMKPAEAAAVLTNLKDDAVVSLVMKMKERNAAKILAALPIDQATRVAEKMADMANVAGRK